MKSLVGYTGFVGSNLCASTAFDALYNSKNIAQSYGTKPSLLVYAGVRAEMYLANNFPEKDFLQLQEAFENISKIAPERVVLVSTISVYGANPRGDEDSITETNIKEENLSTYGKNRLWLEKQIEQSFPDNHLIVRLPALYGKNLKKNFIYDYINVIPSLLKYEKFAELSQTGAALLRLADFYERQENGFYKCKEGLGEDEREKLVAFFKEAGFSALNFTDSRSRYQFFNLAYLWGIIEKALGAGIEKLNITSEPICAGELYEFLERESGKKFVNELPKPPFNQDLRSKYAGLFGGADGYFFRKDFVREDIKRFVGGMK